MILEFIKNRENQQVIAVTGITGRIEQDKLSGRFSRYFKNNLKQYTL